MRKIAYETPHMDVVVLDEDVILTSTGTQCITYEYDGDPTCGSNCGVVSGGGGTISSGGGYISGGGYSGESGCNGDSGGGGIACGNGG